MTEEKTAENTIYQDVTEHVMIPICISEYERLYEGNFIIPQEELPEYVGVWVTPTELKRGIGRWMKLSQPDPLTHNKRLRIVEIHQTMIERYNKELTELRQELSNMTDEYLELKRMKKSYEDMTKKADALETNKDLQESRLKAKDVVIENKNKEIKKVVDGAEVLRTKLAKYEAPANILQRLAKFIFRIP